MNKAILTLMLKIKLFFNIFKYKFKIKLFDKYIAGNGKSCKVNSFFCETNLKNYIGNNRNETEGCECCELI